MNLVTKWILSKLIMSRFSLKKTHMKQRLSDLDQFKNEEPSSFYLLITIATSYCVSYCGAFSKKQEYNEALL